MNKKRSWQEACLTVAMWWADTLRKHVPQNMGAKSAAEINTEAMIDAITTMQKTSITSDQIDAFEKHLFEKLIMQTPEISVRVDYHPSDILNDACTATGLTPLFIFPIKTYTRIDKRFRVLAKSGYGAGEYEIY